MLNRLCAIALTAQVIALCGCSGPPVPPSKLVGPASVLMVAPERLPSISEGDDLVQHTATVRKLYGREARKLRRLQRWVRTATK